MSAKIYVKKDPASKSLSWDNLYYGKGYAQHTSEDNKDKVVPVGIGAPAKWFYGIGSDELEQGFVGFGCLDDNEIYPGDSIGGLLITSPGLPGLSDAILQPDIDYDNLPNEYWGNEELSKKLLEETYFKTKTIAPTAPPKKFDPSVFIDYIISLKHQSVNLGWINNEGVVKSLDVKLTNAKDKIAQNNSEAAKNILKAFINEVEAQGCESHSNCPKGK